MLQGMEEEAVTMGTTSKLTISNVVFGFIFLGVHIPVAMCTDTYTTETTLRSSLSSGYDRFVRPSSPTTVHLYYSIKTLRDLDITLQTMGITGWTTMYWEDPRLAWDPSNHSNIQQLDVDWVWRPEYGTVNSINSMTYIGADSSTTRVRVFNTGWVRWIQFMGTDTQCDVDISMFPFDTQTCSIENVFWGSSTSDVTFNLTMTTISTMRYVTHGEWRLDSTSVTSMDVDFCCPTSTHKMFFFTFTYSRMRQFYIMNIIIPAILLSICSIWVFYLPTDSGERLGFSLTILLSYTVQMSITAALMPTTSKQVPHIAMYLLLVLGMCTLVLCNVVVHVKVYYLEGCPPDWFKKLYKKLYPIVFCRWCRCNNNKVEHEDTKPSTKGEVFEHDLTSDYIEKPDMALDTVSEATDVDTEDSEGTITWKHVSILMDRCCFFIYATVIMAVNTYFLITLYSAP